MSNPVRASQQSSTPKHPWVYRTSKINLVAVATLLGVGVWLFTAGADLLWIKYEGLTAIPMATLDALLSLTFGGLMLKLMLAQRARHRDIVQRFETIAEMNHHIRNALERIELSAHVTRNENLIHEIHGATARIQWALREVLPGVERQEEDD